jgi:hypothetical protein
VAVGNLRRLFQRDIHYIGQIYFGTGYERYSVWIAHESVCILIFFFAAKGYLDRVEQDPTAVVCLGDSAYHRSTVKEKLGIGRPVPLPKDGIQQKVRNRNLFFSHN